METFEKNEGGALVDLGNVVIAYRLSGLTPQNYHTYDFDSIPEEPGAFEGLRKLNRRFDGNVTIVWKATDDAVGKNMRWLERRRFTERTGISMERVCRTVEREDKPQHICDSSKTYAGMSVVIDDRLEVLGHFVGKIPRQGMILFRPQILEIHQFAHNGALHLVRDLWSWEQIESHLGL